MSRLTARVSLDIRSRPQHLEIQKRFEKVFFTQFDRREILLITSLLFASMPALHYDAPRRQLAMYTRALQLMDEAFALPTAQALLTTESQSASEKRPTPETQKV